MLQGTPLAPPSIPHEPQATALFFVVVALLLAASALLSQATQRLRVPAGLVFLAIGMLAGSEGLGGIAFDDYRFAYRAGSAALALILFDGGLNTPVETLRRALAPAGLLATVGVVGTMFGVAFVANLLGLPWSSSFLLGAIVSSTDAAAVFAVRRGDRRRRAMAARAHAPPRERALLGADPGHCAVRLFAADAHRWQRLPQRLRRRSRAGRGPASVRHWTPPYPRCAGVARPGGDVPDAWPARVSVAASRRGMGRHDRRTRAHLRGAAGDGGAVPRAAPVSTQRHSLHRVGRPARRGADRPRHLPRARRRTGRLAHLRRGVLHRGAERGAARHDGVVDHAPARARVAGAAAARGGAHRGVVQPARRGAALVLHRRGAARGWDEPRRAPLPGRRRRDDDRARSRADRPEGRYPVGGG